MKDVEACLRFLRQRIDSGYDSASNWSQLGLVLYEAQRLDEALEALDRALAIDPHYREAVATRCFTLGELGRVPEGFSGFKVLHTKNPDDFYTALGLGVFCMRYGWKGPGLAQILRAETVRPGIPFVLTYAAVALEEHGETSAAKDRDRRALQAFKRMLSWPSVWTNVLDASKRSFYRVWKNPHLPKVTIIQATFLRENGREEEAERHLLRANSRFPGHPELMVETGRYLLAQGKTVEATHWFTAAVCMDETDHRAFHELGFLHVHNRKMDLAVRAMEHAVALRPLFPDYRYHLGSLLLELGREDDAIAEFQTIRMLDPTDGHCAVQLAGIHLARKEWERAIEVLRSGRCGDWTEAQVLLAQAYRGLGRDADARSCLERALSLDATHAEAKELLGAIAR